MSALERYPRSPEVVGSLSLTFRMNFCSSVKSAKLVVKLDSQASWEEGVPEVILFGGGTCCLEK